MTHHHLHVGDTAPEFSLNNQDNQAVNPTARWPGNTDCS